MSSALKIIFGLSLLANMAVAVLLWRDREGARAPNSSEPTTALDNIAVSNRRVGAGTATPVWDALRTPDDLKAIAARLEAEGLPLRIREAVIKALIHDRFAVRRASLLYPDGLPFWKQTGKASPQSAAALATLDAEKDKLLGEILGEGAAFDAADVVRDRQWRYGPMPKEKVAAVMRIEKDYRQMQSQVMVADRGLKQDEIRTRFQKFETERLADLQSAMTPQEFESYQLRNSRAGENFLSRVRDFDLTEDEAVYMIKGQQAMYAESLAGGPVSFSAMSDRFDDSVRSRLGDARFFDYLSHSNAEFSELTKLTATMEVTPAQAYAVIRLQRSEAAVNARNNPEQLPQLREQVVRALGRNAADAYFNTSSARWLAPRPAVPPPPSASAGVPAPRR